MKQMGLLLLCLILLTACGPQTAPSAPQGTTITARVEPDPPAVGESTVIVTLQDAGGNPIEGAQISIHGDMDHAGMEPVDRDTSTATDGEYRVPFEWTMGGGWILEITAQLPDQGGEISDRFEFFVEAISRDSIINQGSSTPSHDKPSEADDADIIIEYVSQPDPPVFGYAEVFVTLTDRQGNPITGATVSLTGTMMHDGMEPVEASATHIENGEYRIEVEWTMAGDWLSTITVTLPDGTTHGQTFDQRVVIGE